MKEQSRVETLEDFKLRIAAIIRAQPNEIPSPRRPHARLAGNKKTREQSKSKTSRETLMHIYEVRPRKDKRGFDLSNNAIGFLRTFLDGREQY
jgi:hypothetical protein